MITYVIDAVRPLVDEVLVVTDSEGNKKELSKILCSDVKLILDECDLKSPIVGALAGFKHAEENYSLLLSSDSPLISAKVMSLLLDLSDDYDAVIPEWPGGYIEPLQAVYHTRKAFAAAFSAISNNELRMRSIISRLRNVLYVSTITISKIDPPLYTFLNVNIPQDLKQIEKILKASPKYTIYS